VLANRRCLIPCYTCIHLVSLLVVIKMALLVGSVTEEIAEAVVYTAATGPTS
jgi:hypothetical protein